uniref:Putative AMP binding protein n=1 Tax=Moniliophthora roreri TaxID=221103 RepID=A0A0W0EX21_MONRR
MSPRIYKSSAPSVVIKSHSIFTHLLSSTGGDYVGRHPGNTVAYIDAATGATLSRAQLKSLAFKFGHGLTTVGAKRGDTILMYSPNSLAWPVVILGAIAAGIRCTFANSAYTGSELAHQYHDSNAFLLMTTPDCITVVRDMFKALQIPQAEGDKRIIVISDSLAWAGGPRSAPRREAAGLLGMEELLTRGTLTTEAKFDGKDAQETAFLCYSSGTTGKPKGVETTHQNVTSLIDIVERSFPSMKYGEDKVLAILPFYHIYGFVKCLLFPLSVGVPAIIQQRFEPVQFCANIENYKITVSLIVPPVLVVLARHPVVDKHDLSSIKVLFSGAAPLSAGLTKQVKDRITARWKNNVAIVQGYGLTETSPTTHLLPVVDDVRKMGSVGILLSSLEARLVADDEGDKVIDAEEGQPGELWIRGPTVMKGYLNNSTATNNSITPDRWFKTGDVAIRDNEGYYFIVDRRKELIKYKVR